jgi:hypothetical protein
MRRSNPKRKKNRNRFKLINLLLRFSKDLQKRELNTMCTMMSKRRKSKAFMKRTSRKLLLEELSSSHHLLRRGLNNRRKMMMTTMAKRKIQRRRDSLTERENRTKRDSSRSIPERKHSRKLTMAEATTDRADTTGVASRLEAAEVPTQLDPTMAHILRPSTNPKKELRKELKEAQKAEIEVEEEAEVEEEEVEAEAKVASRRGSTEAEVT